MTWHDPDYAQPPVWREWQSACLKELLESLGYSLCIHKGRLYTWPPRSCLPEELHESAMEFEAELMGLTKELVITKFVPPEKPKWKRRKKA